MLGILITLSIPLLVVSLSLNGVGIGGQQVVGVVDALHEANKVSCKQSHEDFPGLIFCFIAGRLP